jgi:hypothetical protein
MYMKKMNDIHLSTIVCRVRLEFSTANYFQCVEEGGGGEGGAQN